MSADNYWVVRAVEGDRFAVVMGFASDDYDESGGYPAVGIPDRRFDSLDEALAWTLSDEAGITEYNTVVHPECLDVVEGDDIVKRLTRVAEGKFDSMSLDLLREAAAEIERLRVDNERLLQILRRSLPKRPGVLGDISDEAAVDDITHPALSGELGEIVEMETTFVDAKGAT